jgi:hypothetical protein
MWVILRFLPEASNPCRLLPCDFECSVTTVTDSERIITQEWTHTLEVGECLGRWDLSFILTVQIIRMDADEDAPKEVRVLSFDPESEVGTGSIIK